MKKPVAKLALILAGPLVFFGLVEGALYLAGLFEPLPVLQRVTHQGRSYWATNPDYGPFALRRPDAPMPHHVWLPEKKDPSKLRVVMLGESAVAGFPSEEYSLGRLTRVLWNESFPARPMEMATVAMVGANSHILRQFAIESMKMQPDVLVIYTGNNEVIGPYGPVSRLAGAFSSQWMVRASMFVRNTRVGCALERSIDALAKALSREGEKSWKGLDEHKDAKLAADDPALGRMLEQTRANYRDIVETALRNKCKVLFCVPAVNLTDWPPMASAPTESESAQRAYDRAQQLQSQGDMAGAWENYRRACDLDLLRFRADSRVRQLQRDVVADETLTGVALVDADRWLHEWNPAFPGDREYFLEHVHLTFPGRVAVAALITDGIAELTGRAPPLGVGRESYPAIAQWWERFTGRVQAAKDRVLFTEFDDAYLWDATQRLYNMKVFRGMSDIDQRQREAAAKAEQLRAEGFSKWTPAKVEEACTRAAAKEPEDGWIDMKAAELLANLGSVEAARRHIAAARDKYPRLAQVYMALAQEALRDGQPKVALEHLEKMGELLPSGAKPAGIYAEANLKAGDPSAAIPFLQKIASIDPGKAGNWLELAKAQNSAGHSNEAIATCRRGMEKAGQSADLTAMLARLLAEDEGSSPETRKESLELARAAAQLDPHNVHNVEVLALALMANGYVGEAQLEAGKVIAQASAAGNLDIATSMNKALNRVRQKSRR